MIFIGFQLANSNNMHCQSNDWQNGLHRQMLVWRIYRSDRGRSHCFGNDCHTVRFDDQLTVHLYNCTALSIKLSATKDRTYPTDTVELTLSLERLRQRKEKSDMDTHSMQELKTGDALESNVLEADDAKEQKSEKHESEVTEAGNNTSRTSAQVPWLQYLIQFCGEVSVVGLRYVSNSSSSVYRRSAWILLILVGVAVTAYQIQDRIRYYCTNPVNVVIRQEFVDEMTFPTVTICNENRISLSKISSLGKCRVVLSSFSCSSLTHWRLWHLPESSTS